MYCPTIIDNSDPGKPVYKQSIHNQQLYIQCRFPQWKNIFVYEDGIITSIRFQYGIDEIIWFITEIASKSGRDTLARFTDPDVFLKCLNKAWASTPYNGTLTN